MSRWKVIEDEWLPVPITGRTPPGKDTLHDVAIMTNIEELMVHPFYLQFHDTYKDRLGLDYLHGFIQARYIPGDPKPGTLYIETLHVEIEATSNHCSTTPVRRQRPRTRNFLR